MSRPELDKLKIAWKELNQDKQRKEYSFIKVDRNFIQNNEYTTTQKGLYILLLCLSKPITTNVRYTTINVNELISYVTTSKDTRTKKSVKALLLNTLMELQEHEIIVYDGMNKDRINVYINVDVTPFTKLYEIDALNILDVLTTSRAANTLTLYALYAFVYVSVGNGIVKNKGVYIHGLTYICDCLGLEYRTLQRHLDELEENSLIVKSNYMESKNKKKVVISLFNDIDIMHLSTYTNKRKKESKKDNKQLDQEQQQETTNDNTSDDKDNQEQDTKDSSNLDNEKETSQENNTSDKKETSQQEQEKLLKVVRDYTELPEKDVYNLATEWNKKYTTREIDWCLHRFTKEYDYFVKHNNPTTKHKINWLKKAFNDNIDDIQKRLRIKDKKEKAQSELLEKTRQKRLFEDRNRPKNQPYQRKAETGGKAKWQWIEDEEEPNTNSDTSKKKQE